MSKPRYGYWLVLAIYPQLLFRLQVRPQSLSKIRFHTAPFISLSGVQVAAAVSVTGVTYLQSPRRSRGMDLFARLGRRGLEVGLLGGLQWKSVTHAAMASEHRRNQISADTM
jgi:hypothetical protein